MPTFAGEERSAHPERLQLGTRMRAQREAMKMTVAQLARQLGVSRNTITNYEAGRTEPSASELVQLAHALGCPIEELLDIPPSAPPKFLFRAHGALRNNPALRTIARRFLRAYDELEEITESRLPDRLSNYVRRESKPTPPWEIESLAEELRHQSGLHDTGPEKIVAVLESWGIRCIFFPFEIPGFDALSAIQGDAIQRERRLILLNDSSKNVERIIFSTAHELGHFVLHPDLFAPEEGKPEAYPGVEKQREKEADLFAGCFLVPTQELRRAWRELRLDQLPLFYALLQLKKIFRVSYHCLFYRLQLLELTEMDYPAFIQHTKKSLGVSGKVRLKDLEPEPIPSDSLYRTTRFYLLVQSAFIRELIGVAKVAEWLQITVEKAQEETAQWLRPLSQSGHTSLE